MYLYIYIYIYTHTTTLHVIGTQLAHNTPQLHSAPLLHPTAVGQHVSEESINKCPNDYTTHHDSTTHHYYIPRPLDNTYQKSQ